VSDRRPTNGLHESERCEECASAICRHTRLIIKLTAIVVGAILYVGWGSEDAIIGIAVILLVAYAILRDLKPRHGDDIGEKH
jgi:hypothetical protein